MIRTVRCKLLMLSLVAFIAGFATDQVHAQVVKPFKITGEGVGFCGLPLPG